MEMMSKAEMVRLIENSGDYCKVRINKDGEVTGMLVDQDYRYNPRTNQGGRRFIGYFSELLADYQF